MKFKITILLLMLSLMLAVGCQKVEKPAIKGKGPLALEVMEGLPAPDYHKPARVWMATHMDNLNAGKVKMEECLGCHMEPDKFCNNCHNYVGVKKIVIPKESGPPPKI